MRDRAELEAEIVQAAMVYIFVATAFPLASLPEVRHYKTTLRDLCREHPLYPQDRQQALISQEQIDDHDDVVARGQPEVGQVALGGAPDVDAPPPAEYPRNPQGEG